MQQMARDEAGNVWELDASGQPTRLVEQAGASQAPQPYTIGTPDPAAAYEAPKAAVDLEAARARAAREAIQFAERNKPTLPAGYMMGPNGQAVRVPGLPAEKDDNAKDNREKAGRVGKLQALAAQIRRVRQLYDANIAPTSGLGGIADYLPSEANRQFDTAGAGLAEQGLAAFRVPGVGAQSDTELRQFTQANKPQASDYDISIEEKLRQLQMRTDSELQGLGQKPIDWNAQQAVAPAIGGGQQQRQAAVPGGGGPNYFDPGTGPGGPTLNGGGGTQTVADPTKAGVAARINQLLRSGAPDAQVQQYATSVGADPASLAAVLAFRKQNPGYTGNYNASDLELKDEQVGLFRGAVNSAAQSAPGAYFINAADGLTAGTLDNMTDNPALARAGLAGVREAQPGASLLGTISGAGLAAGGAELGLGRAGLTAGRAALAGDALYGAAYGAGSADEGNRFVGAGVGAAGGTLGGIAGRAAARGIGSALTGVRNADVQGLRAAGIPLTAGQALGGTAQRIENSLTSIPGIGDMVANRYRDGVAALRPAAVREAVSEVPNNITVTTGRDALDQGRAAVGDAYDSALGGVNLTVDPAYRRELGAALQGANSLPQPLRDTFTSTMQNRVAPQFTNQSIDGRGLQAAVQGLRRDSGDLIRRSEIQSDLFADRATDVEEALFNLAERQAPGTPGALQAANRANRGLSIVEEASARAMNNGGDFTAAQLGQSIRQNARRFNGMRAMNSGKAPLQALQEAAQRVLPSVVPDSGTTGRALVGGGLGVIGAGGLGGGAGYAAGDAQTGAGAGLLGAAALALGGSKAVQRALTAALLDRPDVLIRLGEGVQRKARIGGLFGAPMLAGGAVGLTSQ